MVAVKDREEDFTTTIRGIFERVAHLAEEEGLEDPEAEGRMRDLIEASIRRGAWSEKRWGLPVERMRTIAIGQIEEIYTCEHGLRTFLRCDLCDGVTPEDLRVVSLIAEGLDTEGIAEELGVSRYTVRDMIRRLRKIVGADTMLELPSRLAEYEARI